MPAADATLPMPGTPFIGRRRELKTLGELFDRGERLVVIVGAGGLGKTRLAIEHARRRAERHEAVRFCDLTEQRDPEGLVTAVARATSARGATSEEVLDALRRLRRTLLVLDNVEQLAPHARALTEWLGACPELRMLVTSREILRLSPEVVLELDPLELSVPEDEDRPSEALMLWSSLRQRLDPSYSTSKDDRDALERIVRRLDGIPLAIELAAARANLMSTRQLLARLEQRFDVLRQRSRDRTARRATMEGALDWSWELLEPAEQRALAQCSVFRGGFSLDAAESVLDVTTPHVLDVLQALRDKSLVRRERGDRTRLVMFATIRDYAARKLELDGGTAEAEHRHGRFYAALGRALVDASLGATGAEALAHLAADLDNFLAVGERAAAAAEHARADAIDDALDALVASDAVFAARGPAGGHLELLDAVLAVAERAAPDPLKHARALRARGLILAARGRIEAGRADMERAVELSAIDPAEHGRALLDLSWAHLRVRALDRVEALCTEAREIAARIGDRQLEGMALGALGAPPKERGDVERAAALYGEALRIHRETANRRYEGLAHARLAILRLEHGDVDRTEEHAGAALTIHREFGLRAVENLMLQVLGGAAHVRGKLDEARDRYAASAALSIELGDGRLHGTALGYRAITELELGDLDGARAHLADACRATAEVGEHRHGALFRAYAGAVLATAGDDGGAEAQLARAKETLSLHPDPKIERAVDVLCALPAITRAARAEPGQRREAEAILARAIAPRGALDPVRSSADVRIALRIARHALEALACSDAEHALRVDPSGAWFEPPSGERIDCRRRQALRRILARLARARVQQPGVPIAPESLIAAGWPDEKMTSASAQNRLYVTINRLRQLGLGDALQLVEGGYRIDPEIPLALVPG